MTKIFDLAGKEHDVTCIACAIQKGDIALPVERVAETKYFVAEQDCEYPIEGFLIVVSKRHIKSIAEFTNEEQTNFITFLTKCRKAMKETLKIDDVTIIQEETSTSSHFHVWLFPWLSWMSTKDRKISSILEVMKESKIKNPGSDLGKVKQSIFALKTYFGN